MSFSRVRIWPRPRWTRWRKTPPRSSRIETWGLRNIAYRIAKNRKAHYVALDFDAPAPAVAELERQTQINEDVIRYMTIRVDEHEQGPSAMMRRGERDKRRGDDDRGDRGPRRGRDDYEL